MIEKRIRRDFHFVKINPLVRRAQPDRHGVTDEMDFVAPRCKLNSQFRRNHPGAAVRRIACDSDFHSTSLYCSSRVLRAATGAFACALGAWMLDSLPGRLHIRRAAGAPGWSDFREK